MPEEYQPSADEKKLLIRYTMEGSLHTWEYKDKVAFIAYINKKAGLPFGTIGLLRTEYEDYKTKVTTIVEKPYASRETTMELAELKDVSLEQKREYIDEQEARYTYRASREKRFVEAVGSCSLVGKNGSPLPGVQRSNKIMHAETKSKRRATLEVCGLAFLDDTEVVDIEGAKVVELKESGEAPKPSAPSAATTPAQAGPSAQPTAKAPMPAATPASGGNEAPKQESSANATGAAQATATKEQSVAPTATPQVKTAAPAAATTPAAVSVSSFPERYAADAALFAGGDDNAMVADAAHMNWIINQGTKVCGWPGADMARWLKETFGVTNSNKAETLSLGVFKRIATGFDTALKSVGR